MVPSLRNPAEYKAAWWAQLLAKQMHFTNAHCSTLTSGPHKSLVQTAAVTAADRDISTLPAPFSAIKEVMSHDKNESCVHLVSGALYLSQLVDASKAAADLVLRSCTQLSLPSGGLLSASFGRTAFTANLIAHFQLTLEINIRITIETTWSSADKAFVQLWAVLLTLRITAVFRAGYTSTLMLCARFVLWHGVPSAAASSADALLLVSKHITPLQPSALKLPSCSAMAIITYGGQCLGCGWQ